ncbi:MAG: NAD-dependent protein deacylase [Coriobacteriia bacterium]|nr:NAD-dependent protein deacylase [Coriobacteriia bacterium]
MSSKQLSEWINQGNVVFFGGAGVSTESGIPDFRSEDGLYNQKYKYPPEMIISHSFFMKNTEEFYKFYFDRMIPGEDIKPNTCHYKLAELEERGLLKAIVTQNIDGLHQAAGSKNVLEVHGSVQRNYCMTCHKFYDLSSLNKDGIPKCECGGIIKPDVVLYEEPLDNHIMQKAVEEISNAKTLIVAGTSLAVYPAAGLIDYFKGDHLIIINRDATPRDKQADLCIEGNVGEIFANV